MASVPETTDDLVSRAAVLVLIADLRAHYDRKGGEENEQRIVALDSIEEDIRAMEPADGQ